MSNIFDGEGGLFGNKSDKIISLPDIAKWDKNINNMSKIFLLV